jgi:hypothetical protein
MSIESPWLKGEREAAAYARRSLAGWKRYRHSYPVRRVKLPSGSTLYRREWIDESLMRFVEDPAGGIDQMVEDVMKDF